ncbi:unconventional prefoldin RPB5 interactor isoform X1 [Megalopta genalis]|uniref:unconventional prefoldin RPB5 interactor isoform X1 n=1 Tax=Megalopta genalis TaxID=115081 RepID=UPI003FD1935D
MTLCAISNFEMDFIFCILTKIITPSGIQRNEEQRKIWANYRQGHEKVAEALLTFRKDLSVNCMVPIGRGALMKGKLIHTNEVLACLGDGYFAKYSAEGATALCERRIKHAEEMLKNLSGERDLYETRIMALENDLFGDCAGSEIVEHWNEEKIEEWKVKHREREKEYHQKLAKLKQDEKPKIETEEDLFHRLDQLELEEELADEFNRLEGEHYELFGEELEEYSYESGSSSESEEDDSEEESQQNKKEVKGKQQDKQEEKEKQYSKEEEKKKQQEKKEGKEKQQVKKEGKEKQQDKKDEEEQQLKNKNGKEKQLKEEEKERPLKNEEKFKEQVKIEAMKVKKCVSFAKLDHVNKQNVEQSTEKEEVSEEDILRIEFSHSKNIPVTRSERDSIETPADIYRIYSKPKSILKRSPNDIPPIRDPPPDYSTEEEEDVYEHIDKPSTYESVVRDIKERDTTITVENVPNTGKETRPISKFKRDRQLKR